MAALTERISQLEQEVATLRANQRTDSDNEVLDFVNAQGGLQRVKVACAVSKVSKAAPQNPKRDQNNGGSTRCEFVEGRMAAAKSLREKLGR